MGLGYGSLFFRSKMFQRSGKIKAKGVLISAFFDCLDSFTGIGV